MNKSRIGVYVCHCGINISSTVNIQDVVEYTRTLPNVVLVKDYKYMCSDPGQRMIREDVKSKDLNRIVVASCSPRMHESTFRKAISEAGLNPYLLEMANIREQCSWVHADHPEKATEKAKAIVAAAVVKADYDEPLEPIPVEVNRTALVVGGGIAGIQCSLDLANKGFKTYLVERTPSIGGHMAQLDKTFPTLDCSACILTPKMVDVASHPNIQLLTNSEVTSVEGYIGNFHVKVQKKARYVDEEKCTGCGICATKCPVKVASEFDVKLGERKAVYVPFPQAVPLKYTIDKESCLFFTKGVCRLCEKFCPSSAIDYEQTDQIIEFDVGVIVIATGFDLYDASKKIEYGYGAYENVITGLELERLVNASGPTQGKVIRLSDKKTPKRIAFVQCVGSRDHNANAYCSRVCCMASLKHAHQIIEKDPDSEVTIFYIDLRCFGKGYEEFYERVQGEGIQFIRGKIAEIYESSPSKNLILRFEDTLSGELMEKEFDLVVLATALEPNQNASQIQNILKLSKSSDGFFMEAHPKLRPLETHTDGIFLCGAAQSPKDIPDAVSQASGAASQASIPLSKGRIFIDPLIAQVDDKLCGGCGICKTACFYNAIDIIEREEEKIAKVNDVLCKGCGVCSGVCPVGAIKMNHFTDRQIMAEIKTLASTKI